MKKIYTVLALALSIGGSLFALEEASAPSTEASLPAAGLQRIAQLRAEYEEGKFNSLFARLDADYHELEQSGRVQEFADMRRVAGADEELKELAKEFDSKAAALLQERNAELLALSLGKESEIGAERVRSITTPLDERQKEAMQRLSSLRFKTPDQAGSADEKNLIEIDLAYEFKSVHLDQADDGALLENQIALGMEKMKQMEEAAQTFTDAELKETVLLAVQGYDASQSKRLDLIDLFAAAKTPSSDLDRNIGSVLTSYKAKKDDLYQREFLAKL